MTDDPTPTIEEVIASGLVSRALLRRLIAEGEVPAIVVDGRPCIRRTAFDAWAEKQRISRRPGGRRN